MYAQSFKTKNHNRQTKTEENKEAETTLIVKNQPGLYHTAKTSAGSSVATFKCTNILFIC